MKHGTVSSYSRGCRCGRCRQAYSDYSKAPAVDHDLLSDVLHELFPLGPYRRLPRTTEGGRMIVYDSSVRDGQVRVLGPGDPPVLPVQGAKR